ncbi:MAG: FtsQ-type POTRA domain-containing protein [Selenomonadaceae bacterium]|nr:FtsQ-type POTRA domain-containing protein [Selenomonadaceae bacterium]
MDEEQLQNLPMETAEPRKSSRKWQWLFQVLVFLGIVAVAVAAVVYLPVFKLSYISVAGNSYIPTEDIYRIAGIYKGQHMFQVETDKALQNLRKDLRIEQAVVKRTFPNGIFIEVEERRPIACVPCEFGFLDLDRKGMVLNAYRVRHLQTTPLLVGVQVSDLYIGDKVQDEKLLLSLDYLSRLEDNDLGQIVEMNLADPVFRVVARTTNAAEIRIGELDRLEEKATYTKSFLEELRTTTTPIPYIDLTTSAPYIPAVAQK